MTNAITITIRLFGAFRKYGDTLELAMPQGCDVAAIKTQLAQKLDAGDAALLADSAIANDNEIINSGRVFTGDAVLAILPPVCGG